MRCFNVEGACNPEDNYMVDITQRLETIKSRMNQILANNTGKSVEEVTEACERDNFMTADEALAFGIIDRVLEHH